MISLKTGSVKAVVVVKVSESDQLEETDMLAMEEPLEIQLEYGPLNMQIIKSISVTMRTPGQDNLLAAGFLFTEGIVTNNRDIMEVSHAKGTCSEQKQNIVKVKLKEYGNPILKNSERNFYTTSSCGVCGKGSIAAINTVSQFDFKSVPQLKVSREVLYELPGKLRNKQNDFLTTGGIHAAGLFTLEGEMVSLCEDVGRHNALDKLIGKAFLAEVLPLDRHILLLSGRASFELVQKASMAGIRFIAAVGAPSSLAVELASAFNITLIGFLRMKRFNIYTNDHQIF